MGIFNIFRKKKEESEKLSGIKTDFFEKDNKGTRYETLDQASTYWIARMQSIKKDPFVLFIFDTKEAANDALMALNYIHATKDSGKLVCSKILQFGYYPTGDGKYEAWVCGSELTHDMWKEAMEKFKEHGGKRKNDLEPEKLPPIKEETAEGDISKVIFVREDKQVIRGQIMTYRVHKAPNKSSAMAFLEKNPVTRALYYLVVETPEGNFCRDIQGIYKE
jgi:hypothetical protein